MYVQFMFEMKREGVKSFYHSPFYKNIINISTIIIFEKEGVCVSETIYVHVLMKKEEGLNLKITVL